MKPFFHLLAALTATAQTNPPLEHQSRTAAEYVVAGRLQEAIAVYRSLVQTYPRNADLFLNLAIAEYKAKAYSAALEDAQKAFTLNPSLAAALLFAGASYLELSNYADAVPVLDRYLSSVPQDRNARLMLAEALRGEGFAERALENFVRVSEQLPGSSRVWYGLGRTYDLLADRAASDLASDPKNIAYAHLLAGDAYRRQRRFGSAFSEYKQASLKEAQAGLIEVYREIGHADWADEQARLLQSQGKPAPSPPSAYLSYISYWTQAREAYDKLLQLPSSIESNLYRATKLDTEGRFRDSQANWRAALDLAPDKESVRFGLAWSSYRSGDFSSAIEVIADLMKKASVSTEAKFLYGASLLGAEQAADALPYLQASHEAQPNFLPASAALGHALLRLGQAGKAIPLLEAALPEDQDGSTHFQLVRAYQVTGQTEKGRAAAAEYARFREAADAKLKAEEGGAITAP